ncbi:hypothetical protein ACFZDK_13720 [Streptomyces sp. NPDC007901]|uniref:hypothetical protein n=1 Tax=Streptomyces sp. NPDC007901 TaxID=3364785 RepID=UPI0036F04B8C
MAATTTRRHILLAVPLSVALAVLTAGCASSPSSSRTGASASASSGDPAVPGRIHVEVADIDLTIADAVAHLDHSGDGSLSMEVRNDDDVPEHLGMVATPGGGRGVLVGGKSAEGDGSLSTAGILLMSDTTVTFGGKGDPYVLLHRVHGVTAAHTLPVALQFGVAGLVRFQARVASP